VLPQHIRPPLTVGEIMSRQPQVLTPETPVEEADRLMRTFGYEGYPVVENGRVVGLLTRRAVDRALGHGLRVPVGRLMDAGEVTIRPDEAVDRLQQLMTDTGWGQIPVVDDAGKIVGIVTRTDLIKTLAPRPRRPGIHNLAARLETALPPARLALLKAAAAMAEAQRQALYIVGGFVRDLLLERPSVDFDLVVEGNAIALARALQKRYGGRVVAHRQFGNRFGRRIRSVSDGNAHLFARLQRHAVKADAHPADHLYLRLFQYLSRVRLRAGDHGVHALGFDFLDHLLTHATGVGQRIGEAGC